jgi:hypothetical protein
MGRACGRVVSVLMVASMFGCAAPPAAPSVTAAVVSELEETVSPLVVAHAELTAAWAGPDPVWEAAWEVVLADLAALTAKIVTEINAAEMNVAEPSTGLSRAQIRALLGPFPFLFEVTEDTGVWCVAPADASGFTFEVLEGPCAEYGYDADTLADIVAELSQPEVARGRRLLAAGYDLLEQLVADPDTLAVLSRFRSETGFDAALAASGDAIEITDGALAVCVDRPALTAENAAVSLARPRPGSCL